MSVSHVSLRAVKSFTRPLLLALVLGTALGSAAPAWAQTDEERATARSAANEGLKAYQAGDYKRSLDLFSRAQEIIKASPHLLYIARSHAALGHLVSAQEAYRKILIEEPPAGAPDAFRQAYSDAGVELTALAPRVPTLTVQIEGADPDEKVRLLIDGKEFPALSGVPRPIDPGTRELRAITDSKQSDLMRIEIKEGASESATLTLVATPASQIQSPSAPSPAATASAAPEDEKSGSNTAAYVLLGAGALGLGLGTYFTVVSLGKRGDADDLCVDDRCPESRRQEIDDLDGEANTAGTIAIASFGLGVAAATTGVVMLMSSGGEQRSARHAPQPAIRPLIGWKAVGLSGRF